MYHATRPPLSRHYGIVCPFCQDYCAPGAGWKIILVLTGWYLLCPCGWRTPVAEDVKVQGIK